jgi:hypothetical protein
MSKRLLGHIVGMEDAPWKFVAVATGTFSEAVP